MGCLGSRQLIQREVFEKVCDQMAFFSIRFLACLICLFSVAVILSGCSDDTTTTAPTTTAPNTTSPPVDDGNVTTTVASTASTTASTTVSTTAATPLSTTGVIVV